MKPADWSSHPWVQRLRASLVGRILTALFEIGVKDRALTLAGQAFLALIPLLIVLASAANASDPLAVGDWLIGRFALTGPTAEAVRSLFTRPPGATGGIGVISIVVLLFSVSSFARSMQRAYELAWDLPPRAARRTASGLVGALALIAALGGLAYLSVLAKGLPGGRLTSVLTQVLLAVPAWWLASYLLLSGRVRWRSLLPGAVVSAVAQVLVSWAGSIWVPYLLRRDAGRYGVIGVAIALISWLVVLSFLVVASAVVGAQIGPVIAAGPAADRLTRRGRRPAATPPDRARGTPP